MSRSTGLIGIDVAYLIALAGAALSSAFFVLGDRTYLLNHEHFYLILDFFPALFFFLNGLTVTLTMRDRRISSRRLLSYLSKRGSVLFLIGLLFIQSWPLNIFIASGVFYLIAPAFAQWNNLILRTLAVITGMIAIILLNIDVDAHTLYAGLRLNGANLTSFFSFFFFNGYFSILPWSTFFIAGMLFGRSTLRPRGWIPPMSIAMVLGIGVSYFVQQYCLGLYGTFDPVNKISAPLLGLKFYLPAFYIFSLCGILLLMNFLLYAFRKEMSRKATKVLQNFSSSKYSIFLFVYFYGWLVMSISNSVAFNNNNILVLLVIFVVVLSFVSTNAWKNKVSTTAPVEWIIKRLSGSTKK